MLINENDETVTHYIMRLLPRVLLLYVTEMNKSFHIRSWHRNSTNRIASHISINNDVYITECSHR